MLSATVSNVRAAHLPGLGRKLTSGSTLAHLWLGRRSRRGCTRRGARIRLGSGRRIVTAVVTAVVSAVVVAVVTAVVAGVSTTAGSGSVVSLTIAQSSHYGSSGVLHDIRVVVTRLIDFVRARELPGVTGVEGAISSRDFNSHAARVELGSPWVSIIVLISRLPRVMECSKLVTEEILSSRHVGNLVIPHTAIVQDLNGPVTRARIVILLTRQITTQLHPLNIIRADIGAITIASANKGTVSAHSVSPWHVIVSIPLPSDGVAGADGRMGLWSLGVQPTCDLAAPDIVKWYQVGSNQNGRTIRLVLPCRLFKALVIVATNLDISNVTVSGNLREQGCNCSHECRRLDDCHFKGEKARLVGFGGVEYVT
jgi:hypothetical protein